MGRCDQHHQSIQRLLRRFEFHERPLGRAWDRRPNLVPASSTWAFRGGYVDRIGDPANDCSRPRLICHLGDVSSKGAINKVGTPDLFNGRWGILFLTVSRSRHAHSVKVNHRVRGDALLFPIGRVARPFFDHEPGAARSKRKKGGGKMNQAFRRRHTSRIPWIL
jgi:hypothetical protein